MESWLAVSNGCVVHTISTECSSFITCKEFGGMDS